MIVIFHSNLADDPVAITSSNVKVLTKASINKIQIEVLVVSYIICISLLTLAT